MSAFVFFSRYFASSSSSGVAGLGAAARPLAIADAFDGRGDVLEVSDGAPDLGFCPPPSSAAKDVPLVLATLVADTNGFGPKTDLARDTLVGTGSGGKSEASFAVECGVGGLCGGDVGRVRVLASVATWGL